MRDSRLNSANLLQFYVPHARSLVEAHFCRGADIDILSSLFSDWSVAGQERAEGLIMSSAANVC